MCNDSVEKCSRPVYFLPGKQTRVPDACAHCLCLAGCRLQQQVVLSEQALQKVTFHLEELEQRQEALEEAHKALGGGGVQSFVLEGVLGNLQML